MHILNEGDRCSVVAFNRDARTVFPLTDMAEVDRDRCVRQLLALEEGGGTNLWAGVHAGLECLRAGQEGVVDGSVRRKATLMLLTDGRPTVTPPRGFVDELRSYCDTHPGFTYQMSTFGFGYVVYTDVVVHTCSLTLQTTHRYDLDSKLLSDFAREGNGTFAFIPDAVIVGTTFVNSIANVLSTRAQQSTLSLTALRGASFVGPVIGGFNQSEETWGISIDFGPLQHGQCRSCVVPMRLPADAEPFLEAVATYPVLGDADCRAVAIGAARDPIPNGIVSKYRCLTVDLGHTVVEDGENRRGREAGEKALALATEIKECMTAEPMLAPLHVDVDGRLSKALKGQARFNRWGKHYLRALTRAHCVQMCTNFMDRFASP